MAKLTIVVTIYNIENYIDRCLKSISSQSEKDFEVLCINDGSTDKSRDVILKYVNKDNRFKLIDKENGGSSTARNLGIDLCNSEYISFIDGDDYIENDYVKVALENIENNKSDILVFNYNQVSLNNKEIIKGDLRIKEGTYCLNKNKELLAYMINAPWNKIYKTSLYKDNDIRFQEGYRHQDYGTMPKVLLKANKITYIDNVLYNYIVDIPNNISSKVDNKIYDIIYITDDIISFYKKENAFEEYINELEYLAKRNFILALRKVMKISDKKFVLKFIDDVFNECDKYFKGHKCTYKIDEEDGDDIYLSRFKCKAYYLLKGNKHE